VARIEVIDFVKGVAVTAIMVFHCYEAIFAWPGHDIFSFLAWPGGLLSAYALNFKSWELTVRSLLKLTGLGYQGLFAFVVLSGFLQMWTYGDKKMKIYEYYFKRFLRLYLLYWLVIVGIIALNMVLYGDPGATWEQILWVFVGWAPLLFFNPSFWFMILIVQLYLFFPLLRGLLSRVGEIDFLIGMWVVSVAFLSLFKYEFPWAGFFFGCWIFEFSLGMVLANHYSRVDSILGVKTIIPLLLAYLSGFYLSSFAVTWPFGRPLCGTALTLLLWSIYNTVKEIRILRILKGAFVFIGFSSFAMYLINQPFIQEYFCFVTGLPRGRLSGLIFENQNIGSDVNFLVLPISRYLLIVLSYSIVIVFLSFMLTKVDTYLSRRLSSWRLKIR